MTEKYQLQTFTMGRMFPQEKVIYSSKKLSRVEFVGKLYRKFISKVIPLAIKPPGEDVELIWLTPWAFGDERKEMVALGGKFEEGEQDASKIKEVVWFGVAPVAEPSEIEEKHLVKEIDRRMQANRPEFFKNGKLIIDEKEIQQETQNLSKSMKKTAKSVPSNKKVEKRSASGKIILP